MVTRPRLQAHSWAAQPSTLPDDHLVELLRNVEKTLKEAQETLDTLRTTLLARARATPEAHDARLVARAGRTLARAGVTRVEQLRVLDHAQLRAIPGLGPLQIGVVEEILAAKDTTRLAELLRAASAGRQAHRRMPPRRD